MCRTAQPGFETPARSETTPLAGGRFIGKYSVYKQVIAADPKVFLCICNCRCQYFRDRLGSSVEA